MASTNQMKATFISQKLQFLKDQGDHLISDVVLYVSTIIAAGESWAEEGDNRLEYLELLCQMIDTAVEFLHGKCEELAGGSVDAAVCQISRPSCEQSNLSLPVITGAASSSASSYRQTAAPLASTPTASSNQPPVSVQPADETQLKLKSVLDRIAVIEQPMYSYQSNAEKVAEQQSDIDQQLKELLPKLSESDKKHSSRFRKVKEQIREISEARDVEDQELKTSLQSPGRQAQKLCTEQDRLKEGMESQAELVEEFVHLPNQLESVKDNINVLNPRMDRIIDDCNNTHEDIKTITNNLTDKVMANTQTVQVISEGLYQKRTLLRRLDTRLKKFEADKDKNIKHFQTQTEKGEAIILFQMLSDRLTSLEQLKWVTSLSERANVRDNNIKELAHVIQDYAVTSPRLQHLKLKASPTGFGFTAYKSFLKYASGSTIIEYKIGHSTIGNNFDKVSGIFTAPFDGAYVVMVSITLDENNEFHACVEHQNNVHRIAIPVCKCSAAVKNTTACSVNVVDLKVGDKLFTSVHGTARTGNYNLIIFTCFLLG
ncbi:hypothetical protein BsWGS_17330 [Bradybaena similaris]